MSRFNASHTPVVLQPGYSVRLDTGTVLTDIIREQPKGHVWSGKLPDGRRVRFNRTAVIVSTPAELFDLATRYNASLTPDGRVVNRYDGSQLVRPGPVEEEEPERWDGLS